MTLEEFQDLCAELGFGMTFPPADQERLYQGLSKRLGWGSEGTHTVIAAYCRAYQERYNGSNPVIDGKTRGVAKRLAKDHGVGTAVEWVEAYLKMPDVQFVARRHDLGTMSMNLNAVKLFAEGHGTVTRAEAHSVEKRHAAAQGWGSLARGKSDGKP